MEIFFGLMAFFGFIILISSFFTVKQQTAELLNGLENFKVLVNQVYI